jgi:signal transduction histidine kinase
VGNRAASENQIASRQEVYNIIATAAHELKSPLAAVEGYINLIRSQGVGDNPEAYKHMLDRSLIRLEAMRKLIDDMLDMAKIESPGRKREIIKFDLCSMAQSISETFSPIASQRKIVIGINCNKPIEITGDPAEIEVLLSNLVSNAVKYSCDGGKVEIRLEMVKKQAIIKVSDQGIGMSQEETQRLFGDFVRIKNEKTREIAGTGLGLAIVKRITDLYGGEIKVNSEPDKGSTFRITLPIQN